MNQFVIAVTIYINANHISGIKKYFSAAQKHQKRLQKGGEKVIARTYQDLLDEIQLYNLRIFQLECEKGIILKRTWRGPAGYRANTGIEPTGIRGSNYSFSPDEAENRTKQIDELITDCTWMLNVLLDQLADINKLLYSLEGRQYKIFYLRRCENKSFNDIAKGIGISSKQVQRIYKEVAGDEQC